MEHNPYSVGQEIDSTTAGLPGPKFEASVRTMQIIALALVIGVLLFLGVVLFTTQGNLNGKPGVLTMIGAVIGLVMVVNQFVIPGMIVKSQLKQAATPGSRQIDHAEKIAWLLGIYQTQLIVGLALLEGAAFLNLVIMMLERCLGTLGVVGLLLGLILKKFPTRDKVSFWVQDKLRDLQL